MSKLRLMDQIHEVMRLHHYSPRTEESYKIWIRKFIYFNNKTHPKELGEREITLFLSHLATKNKVSASTQNQALSAILFLYRKVLKIELAWMDDIVRAKKPKRLPVVLTKQEVSIYLTT